MAPEMTDKRLKRWASVPFENVIAYLRESAAFAEAVSFGVANIGRIALAEELFQELERMTTPGHVQNPESLARLSGLRKREESARSQIEQGLPLLHSQLSLGVWSVLEASMDDFVVAWLCNVPSSLQVEDFSKIKISIGELDQLDRMAQMQHVISEFKRNSKSDSKVGVERFEMLVKPIGLSGPISDEIRRDIFELSQVRNAILHRASRADTKLVSACPWLHLEVGGRISLTQEHSDRYARAATGYLKSIIQRALGRAEAVENAI